MQDKTCWKWKRINKNLAKLGPKKVNETPLDANGWRLLIVWLNQLPACLLKQFPFSGDETTRWMVLSTRWKSVRKSRVSCGLYKAEGLFGVGLSNAEPNSVKQTLPTGIGQQESVLISRQCRLNRRQIGGKLWFSVMIRNYGRLIAFAMASRTNYSTTHCTL